MVEVAWALGGDEVFESFHLRRHAHGLGYGGHFLSKSRRYSTSFGALKAARIAWREANRLDIDEPNDGDGDGDAERDRDGGGGVLLDRSLVRRWHAVGIGWANRGEALWAESQQRQRHEERRISNQEWYCRTDQDTQQDTVQRGTE